MHARATLPAVFRVALYYGFAGFGGGYSVLAQLRRDLVEKRAWLSAEEFLVLAELSKSLPGTPATSLLALLGQRVGGVRGGVVAAIAFLLPSTILMIACGAAYSLVRAATGLSVFFDGMNAAMVGIVGAVTIELAREGALRSRRDVALAIVCGCCWPRASSRSPSWPPAAAVTSACRGRFVAARGGARCPPSRGCSAQERTAARRRCRSWLYPSSSRGA